MQKPVNSSLVFDVLANTDLKVEIGGGIRNMETIAFYLEQRVFPVSFGFCGSSQSSACKRSSSRIRNKIAVGIDALHGKVAAEEVG